MDFFVKLGKGKGDHIGVTQDGSDYNFTVFDINHNVHCEEEVVRSSGKVGNISLCHRIAG